MDPGASAIRSHREKLNQTTPVMRTLCVGKTRTHDCEICRGLDASSIGKAPLLETVPSHASDPLDQPYSANQRPTPRRPSIDTGARSCDNEPGYLDGDSDCDDESMTDRTGTDLRPRAHMRQTQICVPASGGPVLEAAPEAGSSRHHNTRDDIHKSQCFT